MSINPLNIPDCAWHGSDLEYLSRPKSTAEKAKLFDKIAKIVQETDSYWNCEVKSAFIQIETLVNIGTGGKPVQEEQEHECLDCENFDLSTNICLQHSELGYNDNKECIHTGCSDWVHCHGVVPPMNEEEDA